MFLFVLLDVVFGGVWFGLFLVLLKKHLRPDQRMPVFDPLPEGAVNVALQPW